MSSYSRNLEYLFPGMCPVYLSRMQRDFGWTSNRLSYAIHDIKADIARLDKEFA